jgi:putative transposase
MISYKYNIYDSKNNKYLDRILGECCFVWNHALALQRRFYRLFKKYIPLGKMQKYFAKRINRDLLHSQTTQEILERLDNSYKRFFKRLAKRPPKFKKRDMFKSFIFKQGGYTLNGNVFTINRIRKRFKFSYSRNYEGNIKQIRINRNNSGKYSIIIITVKSCDGAGVGIDFGLKTYLTLSDGIFYQSPLFFKKYQADIKRLNRKLSRSVIGSNNRRKVKDELARLHRKIKNMRDDFQWKLAHELCKSYDYIFLETLNIEGMRRLWGKKISDLSHYSFVEKLKYVASKYGILVHQIDRWYPSSKTCVCGYVNKVLSLKDRTWKCPECGSVNDRDLLASRNILRKGISELESKCNTLINEVSYA